MGSTESPQTWEMGSTESSQTWEKDASSLKLEDAHPPMRDRRSIATRVITAQKRESRMATAVVVATLLAGVASVVTVICTRPLMTSKDHDSAVPGASVLVTQDGSIVETGIALTDFGLPSLATRGDFDTYDHLRSFRVLDFKPMDEAAEMRARVDGTPVPEQSQPPTRSVKVASWAWHGPKRMTLTGQDGTLALIADGVVKSLDPPSGVIYWSASGSASRAGSATRVPALVDEAKKKCEDQRCPLASCVAQVTGNSPKLHSIQCAGTSVWSWPTNYSLPSSPPSQPEHGRQLCHENSAWTKRRFTNGACLLTEHVSSCTTKTCCRKEYDDCWERCLALGRHTTPRHQDLDACVGSYDFERSLFSHATWQGTSWQHRLTCRSFLMACQYPNGCCSGIADN